MWVCDLCGEIQDSLREHGNRNENFSYCSNFTRKNYKLDSISQGCLTKKKKNLLTGETGNKKHCVSVLSAFSIIKPGNIRKIFSTC